VTRADGYFTPWAGTHFGNSAGDGHGAFGFTAGGMGAGVFGGEFDLGYSPEFFGNAFGTGSNNYTLTGMVNLIAGIPMGGTFGPSVRPFVTGGLGVIRTKFQQTAGRGFSSNNGGWDLGGGVMGFFSDHVGLRGDIRYFRNFKDINFGEPSFSPGTFDFWRASIGVAFR
jgi:hypothetical protein